MLVGGILADNAHKKEGHGFDDHDSGAAQKRHSLCNRQQVVPVHTLVVTNLIVGAYPAGIDHYPTLLVRLRV